MPTPRQVRHHYGRISKLAEKLSSALYEAHQIKVLDYEDYEAQSPCKTHFETIERMNATCEKSLARAMREEIRRGNWNR